MNRNEMATELMRGCPADMVADHAVIAVALRSGDSPEKILGMREVNAWPETYVWLRDQLREEQS